MDFPILLNWIKLFPKLGMSGIFISIFRIFLTEFRLSKQCRPWWDAALCGVSSGSTLFAMSFFQDARHKWVKTGPVFTKLFTVIENRFCMTLKIVVKWHRWQSSRSRSCLKLMSFNIGFNDIDFFRLFVDVSGKAEVVFCWRLLQW